MTKLVRKVEINAPKEKVWRVMADFGGVQNYNPSVLKSYSTSDANGGVGATRHCDLTLFGASVEEKIVEWQDGREYAIAILGGEKSPPFKTAVARLILEDNGKGGSIVTLEMAYRLKYGPIGSLMDAMMVRPQFQKGFSLLAAGLKHYCETDQVVEQGVRVDLSSVIAVA